MSTVSTVSTVANELDGDIREVLPRRALEAPSDNALRRAPRGGSAFRGPRNGHAGMLVESHPAPGEAGGERDGVLPAAAVRRLSNWIARAFRGSYGARTGLRMIVRSAASEMLAAGSSPGAVARTFERCVLDHPACQMGDRQNVLTGKAHSRMLIDITRQCIAELAVDGRVAP